MLRLGRPTVSVRIALCEATIGLGLCPLLKHRDVGVIKISYRCMRVPRNKYHAGSGRHCQVDEHLLSSHAYSSDKYGGSTTLLRCASAVVGDHKSSTFEEQYVIPLEDLCPCYQHVHLVATPSPRVEQTTAGGGAIVGDDYRTSAELELPDRSLCDDGRQSAYDPLPMYVSRGFTTKTTATVTKNSRTAGGNSRRSFVTFKPQTTTTNIVPADSPDGASRTAPTGSCVTLDLIKPTRSSSPADLVVRSLEDDGPRSSNDVAVGCALLTQSSAETCSAV